MDRERLLAHMSTLFAAVIVTGAIAEGVEFAEGAAPMKHIELRELEPGPIRAILAAGGGSLTELAAEMMGLATVAASLTVTRADGTTV